MAQKRGEGPVGGSVASASAYLGHGLTWAVSTLLFLWLGTKADDWLGTEPWLALLGAFLGAGAGFYHMYSQLIVQPRERGNGHEE